jgi:transcription antitermination factor NusG
VTGRSHLWGIILALSAHSSSSFEPTSGLAAVGLPSSHAEPHWYAAYLCAHHEKRVSAELGARSVEHFLPLYSSVRRWKDRRVPLELPLFPGYVFVRLLLCERLRVLQIPSVVRLVGFGGSPVPLPDRDMDLMMAGLSQSQSAEPHPFLRAGRRVRIMAGPFAGMEGVLKRRKGRLRVIISLELIQRSIMVEAEACDIRADVA